MDSQDIRYETHGGAAVVVYDRQERRNAWSLAMYREACAAIERANADPAIGAIVVTHEGPVYCAGTDFKDGPHPKDPLTGVRPGMAAAAMAPGQSWLHLLSRSKPVIAAVRGRAIGAGVTQLLPMDIRIGGHSSSYSFPFLELGFMPELGSTALLPRLVGFGRAVDLCLSAATIDARHAYEIGLITRLVEDEDVVPSAIELAQRIAAFPPEQVRFTKSLFGENGLEGDFDRLLGRETEAFRTIRRARASAAPSAPPSPSSSRTEN